MSQLVVLLIGLAGGLLLAARFLPGANPSARTIVAQDPAATNGGSGQNDHAETETEDEESPAEMLERKFREWDLDPNDVVDELEHAGRILREKGEEARDYIRGEWPDIKIIATIKGRMILDRNLDAWHITVGCDEGHVRLSGWVDTPEQISRAIVTALDVEGVIDVESTLRVRPIKPAKPDGTGASKTTSL